MTTTMGTTVGANHTPSNSAPPPSPPVLAAGLNLRRRVKDKAATVVMWLAFVLAAVPLVWIIVTVVTKGWRLLMTLDWWTHSQRGITVRMDGGGAYHAIMGTLLQAGVTALVAVPIGIATAIYLVEYGRPRNTRLSRAVSFGVDILTGVPSIVAALFVYALWVTTLGFDRVGLAVSIALVLLMIPVIVRSTEEMLRLVPMELREASFALGVSQWRTIVRVVLPTAFSGIVTGILLGLSRVMGETAPLLILGPYTKSINLDLLSGNMATLPTMINQDRTEFLSAAVDRTWAAALTLILIVMTLNIGGRLISRFRSAGRGR